MSTNSHHRPRSIDDLAAALSLRPEHVVRYGDDKAKIRITARDASERPDGRLILVSAITPTGAAAA